MRHADSVFESKLECSIIFKFASFTFAFGSKFTATVLIPCLVVLGKLTFVCKSACYFLDSPISAAFAFVDPFSRTKQIPELRSTFVSS